MTLVHLRPVPKKAPLTEEGVRRLASVVAAVLDLGRAAEAIVV